MDLKDLSLHACMLADLQVGVCRKSCGACDVCAEEDTECFLNNRRRLGYLVSFL